MNVLLVEKRVGKCRYFSFRSNKATAFSRSSKEVLKGS